MTSQPTKSQSQGELTHRAMIRTFGLLRQILTPYFAAFGISGPQWGVLRVLQRAEAEGLQGLHLREIGQRVLIKPPSVTGLVDRMERMGLLLRTADVTDQRAKLVTLTPAARELMGRILQEHPRQIGRMMKGLEAAEQRELLRLMEKLALHLETLTPPVPHEELL